MTTPSISSVDGQVDIYPHFGSDASHSDERLHRRSLEETARLLLAYLLGRPADGV